MDWLLDDALLLRRAGRPRGCICLLLCLIDAQARDAVPGESSSRRRFCGYLEGRLRELDLDEAMRVEEKDRLVHISELIYEYFRCNFVHEGDSRDDSSCNVQIEYEPSGRFWTDAGVLHDLPNEQIVFRADWLIDLLLAVVTPAGEA